MADYDEFLSVAFQVTINACEIDTITGTAANFADAFYTINDDAVPVLIDDFVQTPLCEQTLTYTMKLNDNTVIKDLPTPPFTFVEDPRKVQLYSTDENDAKSYILELTVTPQVGTPVK